MYAVVLQIHTRIAVKLKGTKSATGEDVLIRWVGYLSGRCNLAGNKHTGTCAWARAREYASLESVMKHVI